MRRRRLAFSLLALCLALPVLAAEVERVERGNLVLEGIPEIPPSLMERLDQYQNIRSAALADWHPSGQGILISTRFGETSQIHWVKNPGGARRQITFFDEPVRGASSSPADQFNGFLFAKDVGGSEFYQLFFYDLGDGSWRMMTDGESRNQAPLWSNDGRRFAYTTTARNQRDWDIRIADLAQPQKPHRPIVTEGGAWMAIDWSPDDEQLIVGRYVSAAESYPYILDVASAELTPLHTADEKVAYGGAAFAPDGQGIYFISDEASEFKRLWYLDLATDERRVLTSDIPWDIEALEISRDGRWLAYTINEGGIYKLRLRDLQNGGKEHGPQLPLGVIYGIRFDDAGKRLGLVINTPTAPGDVYSLDLGTKELTRWTYSETGGLNESNFVQPELIHFETFDEVDGQPRKIPAFLYEPRGEGPSAVVIDIHGGPEAQELPTFSSTIQFLVNELGVAVVAPNVRGSAGYGKTYLSLDNWRKREDSVKDIGALLDWIGQQPRLDEDRVAVMGGSYGGYMVLASLVHYDERLRAGIDIVGISDFVTFLENTEDYRRDLRRVEYGDERDPEMRKFLKSISPLTHAEEIDSPLLVVQGLNDPRVPVTESEQMVERIREAGGQVWYLMAKDEGHGFAKRSNRDVYQAAVALFLEKHLLTEEEEKPQTAAR
jgi:dipeptidyl aminopeptidase/acylaminoacyl peptidase